MIYVIASKKRPVDLGHRGDDKVTTVKFPVSDIIDKFGEGEFSLLYQRRNDKSSIPQNVTYENGYVLWVVTSDNTYDDGIGKAQLRYKNGEGALYSDVYETNVSGSLNQFPIPERPWSSWVEDVLNAKTSIDEFSEKFKEFNDAVSDLKMASHNVDKVADYLYTIEYTDWDYAKGNKYFDGGYSPAGMCSSVRKGNFYGRNFDWFYDESATFVVKTKATKGRHASLSVAGGSPHLTKQIAESGEWNDIYDILPFATLDGVNDKGVVCNSNVVPTGDKGHTTGTSPSSSVRYCVLMLTRFVLDYADSAADAVEKIQSVNWYANDAVFGAGEIHFMIADADSTYIVEFVENQIKVFSDNDSAYPSIPVAPIMTNFYIDGWDGNLVTGFNVEGGISPEDTTLTPHAEGTERYAIIQSGYDSISTKEDMIDMMESIKYSKAFDETMDPFWYSELVGVTETFGDLTIYDNAEAFEGIKDYVIDLFEHRERNRKTWHTVHATVYDIADKSFTVIPQETGERFNFKLTVPGKD